jgi:hypothetical protein
MTAIRRGGIALLFLAGVAFAQQQPTQPQGEDQPAQPAMVDDRAQVPAIFSGASSSLAFSSETERSNYLRGGVTVGANFDDNALSTAQNPVSDLSYSVLPYIALDQTRSRLQWTLAYHGGLTVNQRLTQRNQGSHALSGDLTYRLSPHVALHLRDDFSLTSNFFDQLQGSGSTPVTGGIGQPNQFVITPLAHRLSNLGAADLSYQFSARDMVGAGGTFYDSQFRDVPVGANNLFNTSTRSGNAYYSHGFTPRNWAGVAYQFQDISFDPGTSEARSHSFLAFDTITLQTNMTLSFFAGPERSVVDTGALSGVPAQWGAMAGGNFGWQGQRTSVRLNALRRVSDGGGILTAVRLTTVDGALRRQITRSSTVGIGALYGDNTSLTPGAAASSQLQSTSGSFFWEQQVARIFSLTLGYARDHQNGSGPGVVDGDVDHNRGWVSFSYNFTRPLGR